MESFIHLVLFLYIRVKRCFLKKIKEINKRWEFLKILSLQYGGNNTPIIYS